MKKFSVEEAQKLIPVLKPLLQNLKDIAKEYGKWLAEAQHLVLNYHQKPRDTEGILDRVIETRKKLHETYKKITDLGVIVRDIEKGLVDFPSEMDGEEIYLCWKMDEEEIKYWHKKDEGFKNRKPLQKK